MGQAKEILLKPISSVRARSFIMSHHYSHKIVNNSFIHLGVFLRGNLVGAIQFGPPLDKRKVINLVGGTGWNDFLEINRLVLLDSVPRNSESRTIAIAIRIIKNKYPWIKWILSYADGTQCGDGTIYRAAGFLLIGIKKNSRLYKLQSGEVSHALNFDPARPTIAQKKLRSILKRGTIASSSLLKLGGAELLVGFQLRYIYFIDPSCRANLQVPVIPFSEIENRGAGMYKGKPRARSIENDAATIPGRKGGCDSHPGAP